MAREQKISEARAITGVTRLFAIVGDPIVQMRSPQGYTQAFAQQQFALPALRACCRRAAGGIYALEIARLSAPQTA